MESQSSTQIKVGIFLSVGIIFILGSIFFLGADKALFTNYIRIHAHFDQVQGLSEGSVVSLSGINVGNVEKITFLPEVNALDVKMKVNENFRARIRKGSQVEIRTQGALGDKFVFIIPGDPKAEMVDQGDVLEVARATDLIGVISERGGETGKIFDIINDLHKMTSAMTANNRMERLMANLEKASNSLNAAGTQADKMITQINSNGGGEKLAKSIDRMNSIMTKIDKGEGSLGALINDPSIHNQLKNMLGGSTRKNNVKSLLRTSIEKEEK
ncbi:ABC transporter substrate-binding protein [Bdellovibrio bacteriovorus]|uniref:ABC transporter substrate-binding protein n=1 Tax=Bdellovibrio bacteriovorus TaxID=959 RepID=A0A150WPG7_BDEBC|nr:MlaD family protein [Bdellovibrio bacteriovorus]KYG66214.1 ABC transporter substrate-binding protein [Bdellovibrio bacteriovorus]